MKGNLENQEDGWILWRNVVRVFNWLRPVMTVMAVNLWVLLQES